MNILTNSNRSKTLMNYLFSNIPFPFEYKYFYFFIIDIAKEEDINKVLTFFEELFIDVIFIEYENKYYMFYFDQFDFDIESIISSLMDDFSIKFKVYASAKIKPENKDFFFITNDLYNKYIANKSRYYLTNLDLVTEIILHNINDLKLIRPIILNDLFEDPQMEILIRAMFDCDLNVTKTASNIYMHRNTVIKRLEQIKNTTGLNIQKFNDANIMYWLIKKK